MSKGSYRSKPYPENKNEVKPVESVQVETQTVEAELEEKPIGRPVIETPSLYTVKVNHPSLRRRTEPSIEGEVLGLITDMGEYEVVMEVGDWAKLRDGSWIMLEFCKKIKDARLE